MRGRCNNTKYRGFVLFVSDEENSLEDNEKGYRNNKGENV